MMRNSTQSWQQFYSSDYSADPREAPVLEIIFRNNNDHLTDELSTLAHSAWCKKEMDEFKEK